MRERAMDLVGVGVGVKPALDRRVGVKLALDRRTWMARNQRFPFQSRSKIRAWLKRLLMKLDPSTDWRTSSHRLLQVIPWCMRMHHIENEFLL
jgi:hypothetical protein